MINNTKNSIYHKRNKKINKNIYLIILILQLTIIIIIQWLIVINNNKYHVYWYLNHKVFEIIIWNLSYIINLK
jgi:hypothetical protein